jgi:hypothetical protein
MKRCTAVILAAILLLTLSTIYVTAAGPKVSKSVLGSDEDITVYVLRVSASGDDIYGLIISESSGSVEDIVSPSGWSGIAAGDYVSFNTYDKPIKSGSSKTFRIIATSKDATFTIKFRDKDSRIGDVKNI